jgi:hypothetical protein
MKRFPTEWLPRPIDVKSGWKNNPKVLSELVTFINEETFIEDENAMMEIMDIAFEWLKTKYEIKP